MKTLIRFVLILTFLLTADVYPQLSAGRAPFSKAKSHVNYGTFPLADIAYANDNSTSNNVSLPLPAGIPFTIIGSFTAPVFACSMVRGGDGNYYLLEASPALYLFEPGSGTCILIGNITGMGGDQPTGISYNPANHTYYMVSSANFYSLDINTLQATLIGYFSPAITGLMIDLCFDANGTCYSYEVNINAGAANAYNIDISTGALTTIGYLGYTPNYGQGMSYDYETGTIYLSAFNYDTFTGQLRKMDKTTGMTTLVYDWGDQVAPFACETSPTPPCPVDPPSNPNPPNGAWDISVWGTTLTWDNGAGTDAVEVWFGPTGNVVQVYYGAPITSYNTGALLYYHNYHWYIKDYNDTCFTQGPSWSFWTELSWIDVILYPQSTQYWTGSTDSISKTDGEINTIYPNVGWAVFDISTIPPGWTIHEVIFSGYVNANNWPYWSATPMGSVNPVTADGATINSKIQAGYDQNVAYIYRNEIGSIPVGWNTFLLGNSAIPDLEAAINSGQGWFAMGFVDRDFTATYYINFDGWSQPNPPYIGIGFGTPVELTSFRADVQEGSVVLNWVTATETNNKGFEVEKKVSSKEYVVSSRWEKIGFVEGNGTTTSAHSYSFKDENVTEGKYNYRLKQIDFDGTFKYSNVVEVKVNEPVKYSLEQNYPNPFNSSSVIKYSIPKSSQVTLRIFNTLGEEIETLVNEEKSVGTYKVNFNASNLPSGVYFYRIKAGDFVQTKKMILLK